jgi:hypothetical protein
MNDRWGRSRWMFWLFVFALATMAAVPSALLLRTVRAYYRFLTGAAAGTIRPTHGDFLDHREPSARIPAENLSFAEFRFNAPRAGNVELIGDFNDWKPGGLNLIRASGGAWEIMVPLSPGRYRYLFLVDGKPQRDPRAPAAVDPHGRKASLRKIP